MGRRRLGTNLRRIHGRPAIELNAVTLWRDPGPEVSMGCYSTSVAGSPFSTKFQSTREKVWSYVSWWAAVVCVHVRCGQQNNELQQSPSAVQCGNGKSVPSEVVRTQSERPLTWRRQERALDEVVWQGEKLTDRQAEIEWLEEEQG